MSKSSAGGGPEDALVTAAIESMEVGLVVVGRDGHVVRYNPRIARWLGTAILESPLATWSRWWAMPMGDGATMPLPGEFPGLCALRGDTCAGIELVWQEGAAAGMRFVMTASPLPHSTGGGAVLTFTDAGATRPRDAADDAWRQTVLAAESAPPRVGVLLVESDDAGRSETSRILRGAGFAVAEATTASDALRVAVADALPMHVLLTDLMLDDETGPELAHQLLQIRPRLSILYMSDHPWGALLPAKASRDGLGLLRKPFSADGLVEAVTRASAGHDGHTPAAARTLGRVLLVDDEPAMRMGASGVLRDEGFEVIEAGDGRAAIAEAESHEIDAVVSDINMAGMTGIDLLKRIRARDIDVPVILMTAAPRIASASTAVEYGAYRYLTKPIDAQELIDVVHLAIRTGRFARLRRDAQAIAGQDAWRPSDAAGLDVRLEKALANLWLEYQPLVRVTTGRVSAFEALVRTGEPSLRSPLMLFAAAGELERTRELGREIRRLAAQALASAGPDADLHVNIDMADLQDPALFAADAPLSRVARRVVLELNERQAMTPGARLEERVRDLRTMGFRFAVDDFGAGSAGLTTFSALAPDMVKLDPSLVRGIHATPAKRETIAGLIGLCRDMKVEVVAEGVELEAERACLIDLGCDLLQGYLLARPSPELGSGSRP